MNQDRSVDPKDAAESELPTEDDAPVVKKLRTGLKAGGKIVWTYTQGGVTHQDEWNNQT